MSGTYTLKRINVGSAFKVGFVLGLVTAVLIFLPVGLLTAVGVLNTEGDVGQVAAVGAVSGVLMMFCGPLVYGLAYGVGAAVSAFIYNIIAGIIGGVEVSLEFVAGRRPSFDVESTAQRLITPVPPSSPPPQAANPESPRKSTPSVDDVW